METKHSQDVEMSAEKDYKPSLGLSLDNFRSRMDSRLAEIRHTTNEPNNTASPIRPMMREQYNS